MSGDHFGLVAGDVLELQRGGDRHVAGGDHDREEPAALGLDVAGEAIAEDDRLPGRRSDDAVARL